MLIKDDPIKIYTYDLLSYNADAYLKFYCIEGDVG